MFIQISEFQAPLH